MLKRSLIALALVAFIGMPAMAHPSWGLSTWTTFHYQWQTKPATCRPIQVNMEVVRWADVYLIDNDATIDLVQDQGNTFNGCVDLKMCNNFFPLKVMAAFTLNNSIGADAVYKLSLVVKGAAKVWGVNNTELLIEKLNLTTSMDTLELCMEVDNVDPQYNAFGSTVDVGTISLTIVPTSVVGP